MANRRPNAAWSFLRDNNRLRGVIKYKIDNSSLTLVEIAYKVGCRHDALSKYLRGIKPSMTDFDILRVADFMGCEVTLDIRLKTS
jgi:hypothetical protein